MHVLSLICMVKYSSASIISLSVIKLNPKFPNNLTDGNCDSLANFIFRLKVCNEQKINYI
jgi:hypothetical protein